MNNSFGGENILKRKRRGASSNRYMGIWLSCQISSLIYEQKLNIIISSNRQNIFLIGSNSLIIDKYNYENIGIYQINKNDGKLVKMDEFIDHLNYYNNFDNKLLIFDFY